MLIRRVLAEKRNEAMRNTLIFQAILPVLLAIVYLGLNHFYLEDNGKNVFDLMQYIIFVTAAMVIIGAVNWLAKKTPLSNWFMLALNALYAALAGFMLSQPQLIEVMSYGGAVAAVAALALTLFLANIMKDNAKSSLISLMGLNVVWTCAIVAATYFAVIPVWGVSIATLALAVALPTWFLYNGEWRDAEHNIEQTFVHEGDL